jgi:hypothetical protein
MSVGDPVYRARRYLSLRHIAAAARHDPVLVFSLGKTGTTSVEKAIRASGRPTTKIHRMTRAGIRQHRVLFRPPGAPIQVHHLAGHYWRWRLAVERRPRTFFCGVREPIARTMSWFFQVGAEFGWFSWNADPDQPLEPLQQTFERFYARSIGWDFFAAELQPSIGIDVYATPFDHARGFQVYGGHHRMVLVRYEDLGRVIEPALAELGVHDLPALPRSNAAADKGFAELYQRFKREVRLSDWVLDTAYDSPLVRHFYTDDERAAFRAHWTDR